MDTRRISIYLTFSFFLLLAGSGATTATEDGVIPDKVLVSDGHVVHDVGQIWHHVSNWGLIGSAPGSGTSFAESPSAQWPIRSGNEYIWAAGLWVGGVVLGQELVSTASFRSEFRPTAAPADTIYATAHGAPGGNRFPWPNPDDDGDGLEDEELLNGLDDDGDGLVDEDFAAIGDQHFISAYNDFEPEIQVVYPDHTPLNVNIVQQSIQWSSPLGEDFIGYDFTITNVGVTDIEQAHLGLFSDFDIGRRGQPGLAEDDYAGFVSTMAQAANGTMVLVQVAYMYDGDFYGVDGYAGWVLCGHTTDQAGVAAPVEPGVLGFQRFSGQAAFAHGGDPTNDAERYELLSRAEWDPDVPSGEQADYRVLASSGPFTSLAPGQSLSYQVALVLGAGLQEMIANAAEAVVTYRGRSYDRDGDPANGDEFTAHWLLDDGIPVAAGAGWIMAEIVPDGVQLRIESNLDAGTGLAVVRHSGIGPDDANGRRWEAAELTADGYSGQRYHYLLLDTDQAGWPREYELVFEAPGGSMSLNTVSLEMPRQAAIALSASPNPFNPRVNIRFNQPRPGHLLLEVFDLRGHLVRTLVDEYRAEGAGTMVWQGDDNNGRAMASGVYQLRLSTEAHLAQESVTLVR